MIKFNRVLFILLLAFTTSVVFCQSKKELESEKTKLQQQIDQVNNQLQTEKTKKKNALKQLHLSEKKIEKQNFLLRNLEKSIDLETESVKQISQSIIETQLIIDEKNTDLINLRDSYAKLMYQTYKWDKTYNKLYFLLTSKNINQFFKRQKYLNQISTNRSNKIEEIKKIRNDLFSEKNFLDKQKENLLLAKSKKEEIFIMKEQQMLFMNEDKISKQKIINQIKKDEKYYKKILQEKIESSKELDRQIRRIIEEEIRIAREKAESENLGSPLTPEALELSENFLENMGKLPWPLDKGRIVERYGKQKHKVIKGIETFNNGVDFETDKNQSCRAVFDGKISRIFFIKGKGKAVLINHGEFYTVYSGLKNVIVKTGDKVISKQSIGTVLTSDVNQDTNLHFEIWRGKNSQNPSIWLYKAD